MLTHGIVGGSNIEHIKYFYDISCTIQKKAVPLQPKSP